MQQQLVSMLEKAGPLLLALSQVVDKVEPYIMMVVNFAHSIWAKLQPYHPEELGGALFGCFLAFFGGHYLITLVRR